MTFYNRNGVLYARINGQRVSTKLKDTKGNRKLFESYAKNDEFFKKFDVKENNIPTVIELCEEVMKEKEKTLKPNSLHTYLCFLNSRIIPFFGKKKVTEIKPIDIKKWYGSFTDRSSVITCEAILKPAFEIAILSEYIATSPFIIKKPKYKDSGYETKPFTHKELQKILDYNHYLIGNFLAIACFTGMRTGELFGLRWSDVDLKNREISIKQQFTKGYLQSPKTKKSKGIIDLPIEALPYFEKQRLKTGLREYIFYSPRNEPFKNTSYVNILLKKILKELNIEERSIYQTRHTFASIRLSMGERIEWVSYMLRHESTDITLKRYFKYIKELDTRRVKLNFDLTQNRHTS